MTEINLNHTGNGDEEMERALRAALRSGQDAVAPPSIIDAAATAGLLDVAYARLDSPLGTLVLASTPDGLARLAYVDDGQEEAVMEEIAARLSPRMLAAPRRLDAPRRELDEYFAGRRTTFLASRRAHSAVADFVGSMLQSGHSVWRQPSIY